MRVQNKIFYYFRIATGRTIFIRALRVGLLVGLVLNLINHPDFFLFFSFEHLKPGQLILTFLVPYFVSTYSSVLSESSLKPRMIPDMDIMLRCKDNNPADLIGSSGHPLEKFHESNVKKQKTRIRVIEPKEATGRLKEIYDDIVKKRGKLADVHKIQSLRPESIAKHMDLYMEIMFSGSELSRAEREMMAVVVSVSNGCEYCRAHHTEALNHYWKDNEKINRLISDFEQAGLDEKEKALCNFAKTLTLFPEKFKDAEIIDHLKAVGFTDSAILDATLVIAYFNFVNRIVLALGLETNVDESMGFKY